MTAESLTVRIPEAARMLGIGRRTAYRAAAAGQLPVIRIGRRVVVNRARLLALIDGREPVPVRDDRVPEEEP
jgi:excisionase family DNA binding protein